MLDDSKILAIIRDFIRVPKPEGIGPVDILQVVSLLAFKAIDHDVNFSQSTLASCFGCSKNTVVRSQKTIEQRGWLNHAETGRGSAKRHSVSLDALPLSAETRLTISDDAKDVALRYKFFLQDKCGRRKFPKTWLEKQFYSAQRILNAFAGDKETVCKLIAFAVMDPRFSKASRKSLYHIIGLRKRWNAIRQAFEQRPAAEKVA